MILSKVRRELSAASDEKKRQSGLVQKGYCWMLKEAGKPYQKEVFDFVMRHKSLMPRTALRYAIEKMPQDLRSQAMKI